VPVQVAPQGRDPVQQPIALAIKQPTAFPAEKQGRAQGVFGVMWLKGVPDMVPIPQAGLLPNGTGLTGGEFVGIWCRFHGGMGIRKNLFYRQFIGNPPFTGPFGFPGACPL
jgi:hypothetical protein